MESDDILEMLRCVLFANGVPLLILEPDEVLPSRVDWRFREIFFRSFDYKALGENLRRLITPEVLYHFEDDIGLFYSIYGIPGEDGLRIALMGPFLPRPLGRDGVQRLIQERRISQNMAADVLEFFNRLPLIPSLEFWNNTVYAFLRKLTGRRIEFVYLSNREMELFHAAFSDYRVPEEVELTWETIGERYRWERAFMDAVARGDTADASSAHSHFQKFRLTPRVRDPVRNRKNFSIILNTLLRKAAEAGGVHPVHIDRLSREFAVEIESLHSVEELNLLSKRMLREYCLLVRNFSHRGMSALVRNCVDYIDFHFAEEVTLRGLAERFSVSDSYLSRAFRRETGIVFVEYLNRRRVRESLILLRRRDLSVTDVALRCGFASSTYFGRVFRKVQGMSPKEYQKSILAPHSGPGVSE